MTSSPPRPPSHPLSTSRRGFLALGGGALAAWALGCWGDSATVEALRRHPDALWFGFDAARARPGWTVTLRAQWRGPSPLPAGVRAPIALLWGRLGQPVAPDAPVVARVSLPLDGGAGAAPSVIPWLSLDDQARADEGYALTPVLPLTGAAGERLDVIISPFSIGA